MLETSNPYLSRQIYPGDTVIYASAARVIARVNDDNLYGIKSKKFADENFLDTVLIKQLYDMIRIHALRLMEIAVTIANTTFLQVFNVEVDKWVTTTPQERVANLSDNRVLPAPDHIFISILTC